MWSRSGGYGGVTVNRSRRRGQKHLFEIEDEKCRECKEIEINDGKIEN